ncbi:MAG: PrsW family intramembrane metalloprotease [Lachnospiraceae bacterium]|nr:PrsW family intramembrane metalloprotease [Lachnospiraceae bacterium]
MDQNMIYILFICIIVPILLMLPLLTGRSRLLMWFMTIGIFACLFAAGVNGFVKSCVSFDLYYITTNLTPVMEEIIKALPILYYAFLFDSDKNKLIPLAFAVGVGFAVLENMIILTQNFETVSVFWAVIRGFASGLMHGICTAIVGYGISFIKTRKKLFVSGTFALLTLAITYHSVFNTLVQSEAYRYWGFVQPVCTYIPFIVFYIKSGKVKNYAGGNDK